MLPNLTKIADKLWSEIIRKRDPVCVWCQRRPTRQAHHIFGRRARSTRWALDNGVGICFGCHLKGHENPLDFHDHIRAKLGPEKYDRLRVASKIAMKVDVQLMILYLRQYAKQWAGMAEVRTESAQDGLMEGKGGILCPSGSDSPQGNLERKTGA